VNHWRKTKANGDVIIVRYADDFVMGFQHRHEADGFLSALKQRLEKFSLALHPDKTRLIEFGRFAAENRRKKGKGKPETFDFLGFKHICTVTRKGGWFHIHRKTMKKRLRAALARVKAEIRVRMHEPIGKDGHMAEPGDKRILSLSRDFWQHASYEYVPNRDNAPLVQDAQASWPKASDKLGAFRTYRQALDSFTHSSTSVSKRALLRQTPKVGARCGSAARRDLCGGPLRKSGPYRDRCWLTTYGAI
jgi:hypothetical protein